MTRWIPLALLVAVTAGSTGCASCDATPPADPTPPSEVASDDEDDDDVVARDPKRPIPDGPNVLVIVWDTVRADRLGTYGYDKPTSSWLDGWSEKARVYERAVSPGVWTLPSHASLFTGLPPRTHGVDAVHTRLDPSFVTIAEGLTDVGYDTYAFVSNPYLTNQTQILDGFDTVHRPWQRRWKRKVGRHIDGKQVAGDKSGPLSPDWPGGGAARNKYLFKEAGPVAVEAFESWLDERPDDGRPWFAFVNWMEVHLPRIPSQAARDAVMTPEAQERALTVVQTMDTFHDWMAGTHTFDDADLEAISQLYDATIVDLDTATASLWAALETRGLADDTVVVLTSDHGEQLGEKGLMLHKYSVANVLSRVPLIVRWDGHVAPERRAAAYGVGDILPDLLGELAIPHGAELTEALDGRPTLSCDVAVTEFNAIAPMALERLVRRHDGVDMSRFARTFVGLEHGPHKVVEASDGDVELYDVAHDPAELVDMAEALPAVRDAMLEQLGCWRDGVPAKVHDADDRTRKMNDELTEALEALGYVAEEQ